MQITEVKPDVASTAYLEPVVQTDPLYRTVGEVAAQSCATSTETDKTLTTAE
jgi:hypothetical protein